MDIDLSSEQRLTFALLDNTRAWRERAVHEFVLRDSDHVEASVAYQIRIPLGLVQRFRRGAATGDAVRIVLPFTVRPKELLLNVDFRGAGANPVTLLPRRDIAALQAQYIDHVRREPAQAEPLSDLWFGISAMTTFEWWRQLDAAVAQRRWRQRPEPDATIRIRALTTYLNSDLELDLRESEVANWCRQIEPSRQALVAALGEGEDPASASECVLLAIPFMPNRPTDSSGIDLLVHEFCAAVPNMRPEAQIALAEYGRRWEVFVDTVVPAGQACTLKVFEQRPWIDAPSATMTQAVVFGDVRSTHIEIRSADHGVVIEQPSVADILEERRDLAVCDAIRETADAVAIYASDPSRPYFARVNVRARVRTAHRLVIGGVLTLIVAAFAVALVLPEDEHLVESLALLTFPLTLAGVVVLSREPTPLAERLLQRWRVGLVGSIAGLWLLTLVRLLDLTGVWRFGSIWG